MATAIGSRLKDRSEAALRRWAEAMETDRCPRCGGLMIAEPCSGSLTDPTHLDFVARRCVQCGEVIDPVILMNRTQTQQGAR
jgi:ribosomal protein S27AE